jgi:hypothetical protein
LLGLTRTSLARALLLIVTLLIAVAPLRTAAPIARADEPKVSLEAKWLLLRLSDITQNQQVAVQLPDKASDDGRGQLTVRQFDPDYKGRDSDPPGPRLVIDKLWLANDIGTAQDIYREQAGAGFPEARTSVNNVGGVDARTFGDESAVSGGCGPCDDKIVHYRLVMRYINAVHVVYIYGEDQYVYADVVRHLGDLLDERIRSAPTGPVPDVVVQISPRQVALSISEMGQQIDIAGDQEGSDGPVQWYWVRFKRGAETVKSHIGPQDVWNKVWVAPDIETAHQIFDEQAQPGFNDGLKIEAFGADFPMDPLPGIGNENFGWSACNDNCMTAKFDHLHHRYVWRAGNVVAVIYSYGGNQDNSINQLSFWAQSMRNRIK